MNPPPRTSDTRRVIVTGSSGFIGAHLVDALAAAGHEVLGLDIVPPSNARSKIGFRHCDIRERVNLYKAFVEFHPDTVLHLAAVTDIIEHANSDTYAANTAGMENVLEAMVRCGSVDRLLCTSSQLVCRIGYVPRHDLDYAPDTAYGESKVRAEMICRDGGGSGSTWCIVRPTTIWGPSMNPRYLPFFRLLERGLYFHIGRRPLRKSYGYVGNVVHQYLRLMNAPAHALDSKVFYLADYEPIDLREWTEAFHRELATPPIRNLPVWTATVAARIGDLISRLTPIDAPLTSRRLHNILTEYRFDLQNTEQLCGPLPFTVDAGIKATSRWLQTILRPA